ncbi:uncharacterized protein [Chelonus insularis]|uniref:uncharacterized protein isoform X2 n=1 Tax=Chelonus insularis TaxID=460826 RepID=UPI001589D215|nr:uncharacterized protein LOC118071318 isoform X2 [Chelonus insularis]
MVEGGKNQREHHRRRKRKFEDPKERTIKLASRDHESRGTRTRRRTNGGSLSSRGSATSMQCGLCAVLASLFRRAMCIAGSRRGSGESCYQELATEMQQTHVMQPDEPEVTPCDIIVAPDSPTPKKIMLKSVREVQETSSAEITVDNAEQNAVFVRISEEAALPSSGNSPVASANMSSGDEPEILQRRHSETDQILLDNLDIEKTRTRHTGRFLTMHKRRRKKLTTRSLSQEPGLLDDIFHGQVQCVLQRAGHWRFNAFTLETVSGGRSLPVLCVHLFQWYGLLQHFNLDVVRVWKLFALIEEGYHSTNPYHNSIHATDVTQAMHCFLQEEKIKKHINSLEIMASLIAAVTHDLDHPGVNQPFLVATSNHLATLYENTSVLENHHWRSAIGCLLESGVYEQLSPDLRPELQQYISSLILATDITRQQEFLSRFKNYLDKNLLDMKIAENRHFILQIALKCADISNPCRPWDISRKWSNKVCEEFFRQGDYERQLNLPVTPLCDRYTISIPKIQVGFFEFVVTPLYQEWYRFLGDGLSVTLMDHLRANQKRWEELITQENIEDAKTEMSDLEEAKDTISSDEEVEGMQAEDSSSDVLLPEPAGPSTSSTSRRSSLPVQISIQLSGRRHSVPANMLKILPSPRAHRRESIPADDKTKQSLLKRDSLNKLSSLSLLSSRSSLIDSAVNDSSGERPVSAENLLPEPSIASITSSVKASRLCCVLQPECRTTNKQLTRQQTFPPLQPYARTRYMSTTAEMSKCRTDTLMEAESPSSSISSPSRDKSRNSEDSGRRERKISTRSYTITDSVSKRRESSFENRLHVEPNYVAEGLRRHSIQYTRTDDSIGKGIKHKRPSSAQDADPAQIFYATLTGSIGVKQKSMESDSAATYASSRSVSRSNSDQKWMPDPMLKVSDAEESTKIHENRRFSSSATETKIVMTDSSGRRFTTIPVASELPSPKVFFIGSPPESPPRLKSVSSGSDSSSEIRKNIGESLEGISMTVKRDSEVFKCKSSKIPKLEDSKMKENVDPRGIEDSSKNVGTTRRTSQSWARRRGSAPVSLMSRLDDGPLVVSRGDHRRGSVPTDISEHQGGSLRSALGPREENLPSPRRASLPQETAFSSIGVLTDERQNYSLNNNNNNNIAGSNNNNTSIRIAENISGMPSPRRGSVPADISELRRDLFGRSSVNGKTRNRKKTLRRRSSGGPEMFAGRTDDDSGKWTTWRRDLYKRDSIPEPNVKRRGSLPVEMVSVFHSDTVSNVARFYVCFI